MDLPQEDVCVRIVSEINARNPELRDHPLLARGHCGHRR
jgi:hypothetical protein